MPNDDDDDGGSEKAVTAEFTGLVFVYETRAPTRLGYPEIRFGNTARGLEFCKFIMH